MLTFDDCVAFSPLTPEEVDAISRCAHMPDLCALEFGAYLLHSRGGPAQIEAMLSEEIGKARARGDAATVAQLQSALAHLQQQASGPDPEAAKAA